MDFDKLFGSHQRRYPRALPLKYTPFLNELKKAKINTGDKPQSIKTHYKNSITVPDMVKSIIGVYNGRKFNDI